MVTKINVTNPITNLQNTGKVSASKRVTSFSDEIEVSAQAKEAAEAYYLETVAKETADVRADLVEQIKLKIQDPNYLNADRIAATADQILSAYGLA